MSKRLLVFGTSITHGSCDHERGGWVERLRIFLYNNSDFSVYNLGVSGDTSNDILNRFDVEAGARFPEIIIFDMGLNDSAFRKSLDSNFISLEQYKENLSRLYKKSKKLADKVIFVGITMTNEKLLLPAPWATDFYYYNKNAEEYNNVIKEFCEKNDIHFVDIFSILDLSDYSDGLHPNAEGHEKIFKKVKDYLIKNNII